MDPDVKIGAFRRCRHSHRFDIFFQKPSLRRSGEILTEEASSWTVESRLPRHIAMERKMAFPKLLLRVYLDFTGALSSTYFNKLRETKPYSR